MNDKDLKALLQTAYDQARRGPDTEDRPGPIHADRSRRFVEAVASEFRERYKADDGFAVFSKHWTSNQEGFKLNELSYDVHVVQIERVGAKGLPFVKKAMWQVESEFARDAHEALIDMSKLVCGSAPNKLFIGPIVSELRQREYMAALLAPARECNAATYLCLVEHPDKWSGLGENADVHFYRFVAGDWESAGAEH
ncbi:MAG TPA: hypothetical protein VGP72_00415 [Planctomycetota bacterium]|jgi:hypothetical protein